MLLALLALAPTELSCAALRTGVRFEVRPGVSATLRLTGSERFTLRTGTSVLQVNGNCNPDFLMNALVTDFNFDGWQDVAVPTGTGYGGVNTFYDLYFYRPGSRTFQKSRFTSVVANLVADPPTHTVTSEYKSGPAYVRATLCLSPDTLDLYTCRRGELGQNPDLIAAASDDDWTWFSPGGTVLVNRPLRHSGEDNSLWTVLPARLPLHSGPSLGSPSRAYVIRGNLVEVLELRGSPASGWAHVTYAGEGGRVSRGWVQRQLIR